MPWLILFVLFFDFCKTAFLETALLPRAAFLRFVEKFVTISFISETIPLSSWPKPEHMFSFVADILSIIPLKLVQLKLAVNCSSTDFDHLIFIGFGLRVNSGSLF